MKKLIIAGAVLAAASAASVAASVPAMAQAYVYGPPGYATYGYAPGAGVYDSAPGYYDSAPGYSGYAYAPSDPSFGDNWYDLDRSDGPGRGSSAESQR